MTKLVVAVGLLSLACGCISMGAKIDAKKVNDIKACQTTAADLVQMFGEPYQRGMHNGLPTMQWMYATGGVTGMESQNFWVILNQEGQVLQYQLNPTTVMTNIQDTCATEAQG